MRIDAVEQGTRNWQRHVEDDGATIPVRFAVVFLIGEKSVNAARVREYADQRSIRRTLDFDGHLGVLGEALENECASQELCERSVASFERRQMLVDDDVTQFGQHTSNRWRGRIDVMLQLGPTLEPILTRNYELRIRQG